jgi:ABC-type polysaccharide/polyol phosphate export permease
LDAPLPPEVRRTILGDLRDIARELIESRELIHQLTLRDLRVRYKQAAFGFLWALLIPCAVALAGLAVRYAMAYMAHRTLNTDQIAGMAVKALPWGFFVGVINTGTPSLLANVALVTKIYFPREVLPLSTTLAQTVDSLIGASFIAVLVVILGVRPSLQLVWVPLLLVMLWVMAFALALFLSCANIFFRDVKYLVQVFLTFGIFVTPVILDAPMFGPKGCAIIMLNPVAPILEGLRLSIVQHHNLLDPFDPQGFPFWRAWYLLYSAAWAFGGLILSAAMFHRSERRFAELA